MRKRGVLVTGGNGFIGHALVAHLLARQSRPVFAAVRRKEAKVPQGATKVVVASLEEGPHWGEALQNIEAVVHTAARVHVMGDSAVNPAHKFREANTQGTLALAQQAARAGVKRFVFISSVKVNGECSPAGKPFRADDPVITLDPYGVSKLEAEQALMRLAASTGMEVVIIRPVLVYGPGVGANVLHMMKWLDRCLPLPFGAIRNQRSLVGLSNLVEFIALCIEHVAAAGEVFMVSDGEDVSTAQLLHRVAQALGRPALLLPVPMWLLQLIGRASGNEAAVSRLTGNLQVDISKNQQLLSWRPSIPMAQELQAMAAAFKGSRNR